MSRFAFGHEVRAVLFDLGNTLMCIDHALLADALTAAGIAADEEAARGAEMRVRPRIDAVLATAARREGREIVDAVARMFVEEMAVDAASADAARAAFVAVLPTLWRRVPADARPTLDRLRAGGYRLGVVSNTPDGGARSRLAAAGLLESFEFVVDSHEEGIEKPDPRIFDSAAKRLGLCASSCVYVGDLYSVDVLGARAAGMHALLVDPMDVWRHVDATRVASLAQVADRLPDYCATQPGQ